MVAHRSDDSGIGHFPHFFAQHSGEVEVVALGLGPDVMRCVVARPDDQVKIKFLQLPQEQTEGLEGEVTVVLASPVPSRWPTVLRGHFQVLSRYDSAVDFFKTEIFGDVGAAADWF